jgi:hypothetical protein
MEPREALHLQLKQERELLEKPLSDFNNKEEAVEQLKLALKDIIFNNVLRRWEGHKDNINAVSEKLVKIPELQHRSAYDLAFLILQITVDPLLRKRFFLTDSVDTLDLIANNMEFKITNDEINEEIIRINVHFDRRLFESTTQGGGLNKSRKKKSLESRKKRRKEKKSLKLRRRRRKRNKKKTKKRE